MLFANVCLDPTVLLSG